MTKMEQAEDNWGINEPRLHFPIFKEHRNIVEMTVQQLPSISIKRALGPSYHFLKRRKSIRQIINDYSQILFQRPFKFSGTFFDQKGKKIFHSRFDELYEPGMHFSCDVNKLCGKQINRMINGTFVLSCSSGRGDFFNSSPGNATLKVIGDNSLAGYRTGYFCRPLNDGKKHFGFTGLNPQIKITSSFLSSIILINHSSDPNYKQEVSPKVRLFKNSYDFLEADFGTISPHAFKERKITDLFPDARAFLAGNNGLGHTITSLKGSTLASIHGIRDNDGQLISLEHSRPAFTNVIKYL